MKKINIVGTSGSGKSTFAKRLAQRLNYPYIEMDSLFWQPNWQGLDDAVFFPLLEEKLSRETWVLDGNYNRTLAIKWKDADTVIWIDYSFSRTLFQALKRALSRSLSGKELWPGTGNKEKFSTSFFSRESIIWWTIKTFKSNRQRYLKAFEHPDYQHIQFIRLTDPKKTQAFLSRWE